MRNLPTPTGQIFPETGAVLAQTDPEFATLINPVYSGRNP